MPTTQKRFFSLKWRLIGLVGSIIIGMLAIMAFVYIIMMGRIFTRNGEQYIRSRLETAATEIKGWFESQTKILTAAEQALSLHPVNDKQLYLKYISTLAFLTNTEARGIYIGPLKSPKQGGVFYSSDGWIPPEDYDWTKRPWFLAAITQKDISFTDPYIDAIQHDLVLSIAKPIQNAKVIPGVIGLDLGITTVQHVIQNMRVTTHSTVYLISDDGLFLTHQDTNRILKDTIWQDREFQPFQKLGMAKDFIFQIQKNRYVALLPFQLYNINWKIVVIGESKDILGPMYDSLRVILAFAGIMALLVIIALFISGRWLSPLARITSLAEDIARGKFITPDIDYKYQDEIAVLLQSFQDIVASLQAKENVILSLKEGDFTREIPIASNEDTVGFALRTMTEHLNDLIRAVKESIKQSMISVEQLKKATQHLSQGSTEQAAAVEEITSSIKEIQSQAKQNLSYASQSIEIMKQLLTVVEENQIQLNHLQEAMKKNTDASEQIKAVVKTIDDIAFQINLLALNANVEAARAGKYGKGFAVVADEVRNLAVKSAQSAKDTAQIVEQTVQNLLESDNILKQTLEKFDHIEQRSHQMSDMMQEIGKLSQNQSMGLDQISQGLSQISSAVQSNAASAEETASAASELANQTQNLEHMVQVFKTK
ncbi:methyl-accepting chemotaxis protein [Thermospira aquatica]|uniref:Methyl-accepting chemotaxis protein n=1 Tax=Thermospira aquatica TaxID=2828656 RepID=A0AAX3BDH2_9SPIR|nr:methyl-accepting chemotaxis protein [Thermospira aquatica]URA10363.1 methyl-accepting chemotaxis protein [Thermospira aquatica]